MACPAVFNSTVKHTDQFVRVSGALLLGLTKGVPPFSFPVGVKYPGQVHLGRKGLFSITGRLQSIFSRKQQWLEPEGVDHAAVLVDKQRGIT